MFSIATLLRKFGVDALMNYGSSHYLYFGFEKSVPDCYYTYDKVYYELF